MDQGKYQYKIQSIELENGNSFEPGRINVLVGANNCGKTQLLKDIFGHITGNEVGIVAKKIDSNCPISWEEIKKSYNMQIVEQDGYEQLKHISPFLQGEPSGFTQPNIESLLSHWLANDQLAFRKATGQGLVIYLNTDNRLQLAMSKPVKENLQKRGAQNLLEVLYLSGSKTTEKVQEYIKDIFETDIYLNSANLGTLEVKVNHTLPQPNGNSQDIYKQLENYPLLDEQGDGIRSAFGIISAIISNKRPIILLDEPEAFLHPPQALQLGLIISELIDESQQLFIATHSADFMRGLLSSTQKEKIIRLERYKNHTNARILSPDILEKIVKDPLLSSARVLEGLFYKGVVATEADADAVFYQRVFQKIGAGEQIHFINAHNKQTLKKIIVPYQNLGIKFAMIADADVLREKSEFESIIEVIPSEKRKTILDQREIIIKYFEKRSTYNIFYELKENLKKLIDTNEVSESDDKQEIEVKLKTFRAKLKNYRDEADKFSELKKLGRKSLPSELQVVFDSLWKECAKNGLFIVKNGELESWLEEYGIKRTQNKSRWISKALEKIYTIEPDESKPIWQFANDLKNYFCEKQTALLIMAAGIGSRFGGGIKQLEPVDSQGHIIMDYSIHDAIEAGFNKVVFIIRKDIEAEFKKIIGDRIDSICADHGVSVAYAFQDIHNIPGDFPEGRTKPWGTGQAVLAAKELLDTPFVVINADDYYGKEGFKKVHEYLVNGGTSCMAGFVLKNTLSDNGGVTRGICKMDEENNLTEVVETHNIMKTADGAETEGVKLDTESLVSMNMWGLTPDFVETLEKGFEKFFEREVPENPLKAEYLIPSFIGELLEQGKISVKVLRTNDSWYGMTYKEDVEAVKDSFKGMLEKGIYKADLFSDL